MTKAEFVNKMAEKIGTKKDAIKAVEMFLETVKESLVAGEKVNFVGDFSLEVIEKAARSGVNPKTGEKISIPAKKGIKVKIGKPLKEAIQKA